MKYVNYLMAIAVAGTAGFLTADFHKDELIEKAFFKKLAPNVEKLYQDNRISVLDEKNQKIITFTKKQDELGKEYYEQEVWLLFKDFINAGDNDGLHQLPNIMINLLDFIHLKSTPEFSNNDLTTSDDLRVHLGDTQHKLDIRPKEDISYMNWFYASLTAAIPFLMSAAGASK